VNNPEVDTPSTLKLGQSYSENDKLLRTPPKSKKGGLAPNVMMMANNSSQMGSKTPKLSVSPKHNEEEVISVSD
jgi:hypothetical protein